MTDYEAVAMLALRSDLRKATSPIFEQDYYCLDFILFPSTAPAYILLFEATALPV